MAGMVAPAWLDVSFVEAALRAGGKHDARVEGLSVGPATKDGENYLSRLFRVSVTTADGAARSLVVKCPLEQGRLKVIVHEAGYFEAETAMYTKVMPAVASLLESAAPGRFPPIVPRCYHAPRDILVLDDLVPEGYRLVDKTTGMDHEHALLVMRNLARMHAASWHLLKERPEVFGGLRSPFRAPGTEEFASTVKHNLMAMAAEVRSWPDFPDADKLSRKLEAAAPRAFNRAGEVLVEQPLGLNVLVHADLWVNNIVFRYEGDSVRDVRFLDLQMSHVGSMAWDLIMFRHTSLRLEVWQNWGRLLEEYHRELALVLRLVGGPPAPSLRRVEAELHRCRPFALMAVAVWLLIVRADPGVKLDIGGAIEGKGNSASFFSAEFKRWLRILVLYFEEEGILED